MLIEGTLITDMFGNELNPGDEVITMTKHNYLIKGKICEINRSVQYHKWDEDFKDYNSKDKGWSVLFTDGRMLNMYKV